MRRCYTRCALTLAVVKARFGKEKVALLAHAWGTILGTLYAHRHPQDVAAYVGVGQIAAMPEGEQVSYAFALTEAERGGTARRSPS